MLKNIKRWACQSFNFKHNFVSSMLSFFFCYTSSLIKISTFTLTVLENSFSIAKLWRSVVVRSFSGTVNTNAQLCQKPHGGTKGSFWNTLASQDFHARLLYSVFSLLQLFMSLKNIEFTSLSQVCRGLSLGLWVGNIFKCL